jgi:hypothetical protein
MPMVSENISTEIPSRNDEINKSHFGVSNGSIKINNTYKNGLIYPPN